MCVVAHKTPRTCDKAALHHRCPTASFHFAVCQPMSTYFYSQNFLNERGKKVSRYTSWGTPTTCSKTSSVNNTALQLWSRKQWLRKINSEHNCKTQKARYEYSTKQVPCNQQTLLASPILAVRKYTASREEGTEEKQTSNPPQATTVTFQSGTCRRPPNLCYTTTMRTCVEGLTQTKLQRPPNHYLPDSHNIRPQGAFLTSPQAL